MSCYIKYYHTFFTSFSGLGPFSLCFCVVFAEWAVSSTICFVYFFIIFCHLWKFARSSSICIDLYVMVSAFFRPSICLYGLCFCVVLSGSSEICTFELVSLLMFARIYGNFLGFLQVGSSL
jgi:hypothetical protein